MRVTQSMMFDLYVNNMNSSLTKLMDLNIQAQTQKRVNKPSDDPAGMIRVLDHRDTLRDLSQYEENIDTAKGWLGRSDSTLLEVSTLITRAKELAEQASTGTLSSDNREQISYEMRSIFEQFIGLANMKYEDKSIYAGHKTDENAYRQVQWLSANDDSLDGVNWSVNGSSDYTSLVQFYDASNPAGGTNLALNDPDLRYRYTLDGGDTWTEGTNPIPINGGNATLDLSPSGSQVVIDETTTVETTPTADPSDSSGTWVWVRPTAEYMGDDNSTTIDVDPMYTGTTAITGTATGVIDSNIIVRMDADGDLSGAIDYSYSLDNGLTWNTGNSAPSNGAASNAVIAVPGGAVLTLNSNGGNGFTNGSQFVLHPRTANIDFQISVTENVKVNDVGKEIFGGVYQDPDNNAATVVSDMSVEENLFETMGKLVGYLETNTQSGVQEALENLDSSHQVIMNAAASVGGREHRLEVAERINTSLSDNETERLSSVEDVDLAELMTNLSQQQIVYESVLRSSSTIMNMNLMKFI